MTKSKTRSRRSKGSAKCSRHQTCSDARSQSRANFWHSLAWRARKTLFSFLRNTISLTVVAACALIECWRILGRAAEKLHGFNSMRRLQSGTLSLRELQRESGIQLTTRSAPASSVKIQAGQRIQAKCSERVASLAESEC